MITYLALAASLALVLYAYLGYPLCLRLLLWFRPATPRVDRLEEWPYISITVPVYNEAPQIADLLESLLALDYPADRRQILIVSDASTDGTDEIVGRYAERGVELLRMPRRSGKTAAENAARLHLRGEIVVNTDASIRIAPHAVRSLVASFADPTVGAASGRDISVATVTDHANAGESGYVGYEMWVRNLETRVGSIVGASGCLYAIRMDLHHHMLPEALSRDFASALVAREHGYRAISVDEAVCYVPRTPSLRREYRRKVRTFTRGIETLFFKRHLLNPARYGLFAWMLLSHKLCRWLVPWALATISIALAVLSVSELWARISLSVMGVGLLAAGAGWWWPEGKRAPRWLGVPAFLVAGNVAVLVAWMNAMRGELNPIWEPTRREVDGGATPYRERAESASARSSAYSSA